MNEMEDRWLSIAAICKYFGVSNDTVYNGSIHMRCPRTA
jgi:predicted DNA-binding transcriptional regulator AlpA